MLKYSYHAFTENSNYFLCQKGMVSKMNENPVFLTDTKHAVSDSMVKGYILTQFNKCPAQDKLVGMDLSLHCVHSICEM